MPSAAVIPAPHEPRRGGGGGLQSRIFRGLVLLTFAWTFVLVVVGVVVRVSGSGLGCPDWPLCQGRLVPPLEGPILIEYSHRLSAFLAIALAAATALAALRWHRVDRRMLRLAVAAVALFVVQAVLGGITVLLELPPSVVTAHLAIAEALLATLTVLAVLAWSDARPLGAARAVYVLAAVSVFVLLLTGAHVRGSGSSLACLEWPLCGTPLPTETPQAIHVTHRYVAALVGVVVAAASVAAWRDGLRIPALAVSGLFGAQVVVGASYVWSGGSIVAQAAHLALASGTWCAAILLATASALRRRVPTRDFGALLRDYATLTKPPIISLLLVTALGGMFLAAGGPPPPGLAAVVLVGGALGAAGANVLNHYYDRDIDELMSRTSRRPLPAHRVAPHDALAFGIALNVIAFALLALFANLLAAAITLGASVFYVVVYTLWLKRTSIQNIVIGGAAGAVPPLVGWAAVRADLDLPAYYLFAIIFFWTPAHFWALALLLRDDYDRAGVPMLPVVHGERATAWHILLYAVAVLAVTVLLFTTRTVGMLYLVAALTLGLIFVAHAVQYLFDAKRATARRMYLYSMLYLALLFVAIMLDTSVRA